MSYSYDDVYVLHAWRDNRRRLVLTQGEGYSGTLSGNYVVKAPRFQLVDERGVIDIPSSGSPRIQLAVTRSNGTEDLLSCNIDEREQAIISCPITKSMTDIAGEVKGEIRLIIGNTVIKFYGIDFFVYDGVSDNAAAQSSQFSDLILALQQVSAIISGGSSGTITLDTVIQHNGINPVASGILYDYLVGNYVPQSTTIAGISLSSNIGGAALRQAISAAKVRVRSSAPTDSLAGETGEFVIHVINNNGEISYDLYQCVGTERDSGDHYDIYIWHKIILDDDIAEIIADYVPKSTTIAGISLNNSISSGQLKTALDYCEVQQRTRIPTNADVGVVGDKWVARLTDSNDNVYYEIYELQRYYKESNAPTVTLYGWEKMIYFSETNRVTIWDAATSATNNYIVPTSQVGKTGDIIIVSPASGTGGEVWQLTKVVSAYGTKTYIWEKQVFANALTNYMKKAYSVSPSDIADVPAGQLFLCTGSIALKTGSGASDYFELVKMSSLNSTVTSLTNQLKISTFSYSLTANGWSSNQQAITIPAGYVVPGDVMADVEIDSTAYNQLVQDGCTGLYISSVTSGNTLTLTAHALGNAPTAAVTIQVTLTPVTDLSE